jgi:hypothetical protein
MATWGLSTSQLCGHRNSCRPVSGSHPEAHAPQVTLQGGKELLLLLQE